jgi:molybdenum cofactor guanylyltransferase
MSMKITGLVLAGGRGTRMGHVDKGMQLLGGRPLAQHVLQRLQPQVQHVMVNASQNLEAYAAWGHPVWPDTLTGYAGPLAGLQTGLQHCKTPLLATVPCDAPCLPLDLIARLHTALNAQNADLAVASTGMGSTYQMQTVFCLLRSHLLGNLTAFLATGDRKVEAWYNTLNFTTVHFEDEAAFCNVNTRPQLQQIEKSMTA